jgi:hypothetical protein
MEGNSEKLQSNCKREMTFPAPILTFVARGKGNLGIFSFPFFEMENISVIFSMDKVPLFNTCTVFTKLTTT